jgi:hypothetical protein
MRTDSGDERRWDEGLGCWRRRFQGSIVSSAGMNILLAFDR